MTEYWKCDECGVIWKLDQLLWAPNPFEPDDKLVGCPDCKSVDCFRPMCDEPECDQLATCGWNEEGGIRRRTCGKHMREHHWPKEDG